MLINLEELINDLLRSELRPAVCKVFQDVHRTAVAVADVVPMVEDVLELKHASMVGGVVVQADQSPVVVLQATVARAKQLFA